LVKKEKNFYVSTNVQVVFAYRKPYIPHNVPYPFKYGTVLKYIHTQILKNIQVFVKVPKFVKIWVKRKGKGNFFPTQKLKPHLLASYDLFLLLCLS